MSRINPFLKAFQQLVCRVAQIVLGKFGEARLPVSARRVTGDSICRR